MRFRRTATSMLLATGLLGSVYYWTAEGDTGTAIPYLDHTAVARGEALYSQYCASCHGADLEGAPEWRSPGPNGRALAPPHDASGHTWHHADELLFRITKLGTSAVVGGGYESDMPGFSGTLSDDEILAVLAFIKSSWPRETIERHNEINANSAQ